MAEIGVGGAPTPGVCDREESTYTWQQLSTPADSLSGLTGRSGAVGSMAAGGSTDAGISASTTASGGANAASTAQRGTGAARLPVSSRGERTAARDAARTSSEGRSSRRDSAMIMETWLRMASVSASPARRARAAPLFLPFTRGAALLPTLNAGRSDVSRAARRSTSRDRAIVASDGTFERPMQATRGDAGGCGAAIRCKWPARLRTASD